MTGRDRKTYTFRRARPVKGTLDKRTGLQQIAVLLDRETFDQIADIAFERKTSFAAKIREYIEWGLMNDADRENRRAA